MLENQARVVSEKAKGKIAQGEIHDAVLALLEILPENKNDKQKPYVVEAEAALRLAIDSLMNNSWKKYALPSERKYFFTYNDKYIFSEKHYFCDMKEIMETMPRIELALLIIGVFVLILCIIFGYAMIHEYRSYLENHWKARYSFRDFIKRERFYIFLLLASIFIFLTNLLYFLE